MGDMADYIVASSFDVEDYMESQPDFDMEYYSEINYLMKQSDKRLKKLTVDSENSKIQGIRNWDKPLSDKQKYCLVMCIVNETDYLNY